MPGGFGIRGLEGKILATHRARTTGTPFLGICLGLQVAVCEYARNVAGMPGASSTEFVPDCEYPVIDLMPDQEDVTSKGGTMRLGAYPCKVAEGTLAREARSSRAARRVRSLCSASSCVPPSPVTRVSTVTRSTRGSSAPVADAAPRAQCRHIIV